MRIIFSFFLFSSFLFSQDVSFSVYVKKKRVEDNKIFKLFLEFTWLGDPNDYRIELGGLPKVYGLDVLGSGASSTAKGLGNKEESKRTYFYNLKPKRRGKVSVETIKAFAVSTRDGRRTELTSQPIELNVIKGKKPLKISSKLIIFIFVGVLFLVGIIFFIWVRAKKKKKKFMVFQEDSSYIEYQKRKELEQIVFEPECLEEASKNFFRVVEEYLSEKHIRSDSILLEGVNVDFDSKRFMERLNEIRYSGLIPDIFELEDLALKFKTVLNNNLEKRKRMEQS